MTIEGKIAKYCSYFTEKLDEVCAIESNLFRKILFVTMLDTLARAPFPKEKSNKRRFVGFIDKFTDWQDKDRISLPQLSFPLESETCSQLKNAVNKRLQGWRNGHEIPLSDDPECDEILSFASNEEVDLIKKCRHAVLLYTYRNNLVHEFRKPGYGMEHANDDKPYYVSVTDSKTNSNTWELVYPAGFFIHIVESSLGKLSDYLLKEEINPYDSYDFGSIWSRI